MDLFSRIVGMFVLRPYVFVFFGIYLVAAVSRLGWRRTALFTGIAYGIAFAAEFSSTRTGIPFGLYHYIDVTRDRELWISNVPFWDSLSFTFLCYLGWRLGVLLYAPLAGRGRTLQVVETPEIANSWRVCLSGAFLMTWLDIVIDPLTVLGDRWFLGRMYYYPNGGLYFGVPLSNFAGWFAVGTVTIRLYQVCARHLDRSGRPAAGIRVLPWSALVEPALYVGILLFNLALTFWIGETLLGTVGILIYAPIVLLFAVHLFDTRRRVASAAVAVARHDRTAALPATELRSPLGVARERVHDPS